MSFRSTMRPLEGSATLKADSPNVYRSSSGRYLRASAIENDSIHLTTNAHLNLKNFRPSSHNHSDSFNSMGTATNSSANAVAANASSSSFFVMVTGNIESATASSMSKSLYCRYTFSYGPDWEVVHGVSMGLSQIGRQGMLNSSSSANEGSVVVWNFPIEISFQSTNPHGWPRLALSIYGFDFLGRDVVCGYASLLLPINPGRHVKHVKTYRPVSGGKCQQFVNWIMGTNPEYYDSKMVCKGEGRGVTRVVGDDGMVVKINLFVTRKDFSSFGYSSQSTVSRE